MPLKDPIARKAYNKEYHQNPEAKARRKERDAVPERRLKLNADRREWVANHPGKESEYHRKYVYGLSPEDWNAMFELQEKKCAICKFDDPGTKKGWQTDHCHISGKVRWILCADCNRMLGPKATPALLRLAADMLES